MIAALLSAIASGGGLLISKITLTKERVTLRVFLPIVFVFLCGLTLLLVPSFGRVDWQLALLPNALFLLFLLIIIALAANVLLYQSIQREKVHEHELIVMTGPVITVLLAAAFFPEEFDWRIFVLALVASLALLFVKAERGRHFAINQTSYNTFLAVILIATETIITRELLYHYTPVALYAIRTFFLAIFFLAYYRPRTRQVSVKHWWLILAAAVIGVIEMLARYYAFGELGVIYTTLIMVIGPVIAFIISWEVLHERIKSRVVIASVVILVCVALATVVKQMSG